MDHEAFREMTAYWIDRWRFGERPEKGQGGRVRMWYRTHPKDLVAKDDQVSRPERADWTKDLINIAITRPAGSGKERMRLRVRNGEQTEVEIKQDGLNTFAIPFRPGRVELELYMGEKNIWKAEGREIDARIERYNFNMWTGSWHIQLE